MKNQWYKKLLAAALAAAVAWTSVPVSAVRADETGAETEGEVQETDGTEEDDAVLLDSSGDEDFATAVAAEYKDATLTEKKTEKAARTILLYGIGSNLESQWGMLTFNLVQSMNAHIGEDIRFVVMTGGSRAWQTGSEYLEGPAEISGSANQLWELSGVDAQGNHGKMTLLGELPEVRTTDMADPAVLKAFLDFGAEYFPAEKYDLILWDHGGGPMGGFGVDEVYGDGSTTMSIGGVARAVRESQIDKLDFLDFDACLMSSAEIAVTLADSADYLIVSPETEPGYGQEYTSWLDWLYAKGGNADTYTLGREIVDAMVGFYEDEESEGYGQDGALAVIDTANFKKRMLPELSYLTGVLVDEADKRGSENNEYNFYDEFLSARLAIEYQQPGLYDLGNLVEYLGISLTERDNENTVYDQGNDYTVHAIKLQEILADEDMDGANGVRDDVIYTRSTASMQQERQTLAARDSDGNLTSTVETLKPSGMSIYLGGSDGATAVRYIQALQEVSEAMTDEASLTVLDHLCEAAAQYSIIYNTGATVSRLSDPEGGTASEYDYVTFDEVKKVWDTKPEISVDDLIEMFESMGYDVSGIDVEALLESLDAPTQWESTYKPLFDFLNENNTEIAGYDAERWATQIVAQQAQEAIAKDKVSVTAVGEAEGDQVTISDFQIVLQQSALRVVDPLDSVYSRVSVTLGEGEDVREITVATSQGEVDWAAYLEAERTGKGEAALYESTSSRFSIAKNEAKGIALTDEGGNQYLVSLQYDDYDPLSAYIPVLLMELPEGTEAGQTIAMNEASEMEGTEWLQARMEVSLDQDNNWNILGFTASQDTKVSFPLDDKAWDGLYVFLGTEEEFMGMSVNVPYGDGIRLTPQKEGRGLSLAAETLAQMKADGVISDFGDTYIMNDIYGVQHEITEKVQDAEARAEGEDAEYLINLQSTRTKTSVVGIDLSTLEPGSWDPQITVTYDGQELEEGIDYLVYDQGIVYWGDESEDSIGLAWIYGIGQFGGFMPVVYEVREGTAPAADAVTDGSVSVDTGSSVAAETPAAVVVAPTDNAVATSASLSAVSKAALNAEEIKATTKADGTAAITEFKTVDGQTELTVPSQIEIGGAWYTVTEIASNAFSDASNKTVKTVNLPGTIAENGVKANAFKGMKKIKTVNVEDADLIFVKKAFKGATTTKKTKIFVGGSPNKKELKQYRKMMKKAKFKGKVKKA